MQRALELHAVAGPVMNGTKISTASARTIRAMIIPFVRDLMPLLASEGFLKTIDENENT